MKIDVRNPFDLLFKMNYNDKNFSKIDLVQKGGKRKITSEPEIILETSMKKAYSSRLPISNEKYKDLIWMCDNGIILQEDREYYEGLPHA